MLRRCFHCRHHVARRFFATIKSAAPEDVHRIPPQLNYKYLAENAEALAQNMRLRKYDDEHAYKVKQLYEAHERLVAEQARMERERDEANAAIRRATSHEERQACIERGKRYKDQLRAIQTELATVRSDMTTHALLIPNETHRDVPVGSEANARVMRVEGTPLTRDSTGFDLLDHLTIAERLDIVNFSQAALVSGSKFYYLKGMGAWLELALIQYAMSKATERGFSPVLTPDVVRTSVAYGCGFQPRKSEASQIYDVSTASHDQQTAPKLCLTGTAEIPLAGMFAQRMLKEHELPQRLVGLGRAFRAEAGHGSAEERGLYRVHQFSKVELFAVTTPAQSDAMLEEFRQLQEEIFKELGLCFRYLYVNVAQYLL